MIDRFCHASRLARGGGRKREKTAFRSWDNRIKSVCKRIVAEWKRYGDVMSDKSRDDQVRIGA